MGIIALPLSSKTVGSLLFKPSLLTNKKISEASQVSGRPIFVEGLKESTPVPTPVPTSFEVEETSELQVEETSELQVKYLEEGSEYQAFETAGDSANASFDRYENNYLRRGISGCCTGLICTLLNKVFVEYFLFFFVICKYLGAKNEFKDENSVYLKNFPGGEAAS